MNVAAFAMSGPQVSAIISNVNACVPISIPLFTKIMRGKLSSSSWGCKIERFALYAVNDFDIMKRGRHASKTEWEWQRGGHPFDWEIPCWVILGQQRWCSRKRCGLWDKKGCDGAHWSSSRGIVREPTWRHRAESLQDGMLNTNQNYLHRRWGPLSFAVAGASNGPSWRQMSEAVETW